MIKQAKILNSLSENIYVKIPIMFTNGAYTTGVLEELNSLNIKLNVTAISTDRPDKKILPILNKSSSILSVLLAGYLIWERCK